MSHASASNGLSDIETHIENAPCNRPLSIFWSSITALFSNESFYGKLGLGLESDLDESSTQMAKDSRSSEHDFSMLDPTLLPTVQTNGVLLLLPMPRKQGKQWTKQIKLYQDSIHHFKKQLLS
jgi:hypothetical protein